MNAFEKFEVKQNVQLASGNNEWCILTTVLTELEVFQYARNIVRKGTDKNDIAIQKITYEEIEF